MHSPCKKTACPPYLTLKFIWVAHIVKLKVLSPYMHTYAVKNVVSNVCFLTSLDEHLDRSTN